MWPSGVQLSRPILPPGLAHADQLAGGLLMERREHHADTRHDDVELVVAERQCVSIGFAPLQFDALLARLGARPACNSSGHRSLATTLAPVCAAGIAAFPVPGGHVQHAVARADAGWLRPARDLSGATSSAGEFRDSHRMAHMARCLAITALIDGRRLEQSWSISSR